MTKTDAISPLLALLRMAMWERPEHFDPVSDAQWQDIVEEARRQAVSGLACCGAGYLNKLLLPSAAVRVSFLAEQDALEKRSAHVEKTAVELMSMFRGRGFAPVIQKGPAVAALYPRPLARRSGDIDIYFTLFEFEAARSMVECAGVAVNDAPDGSINYIWNDVTVEHHRVFFDSKAQFEGVDPQSAEATVLLISSHILKHAIGTGIGLKQMCDMAVACKALYGQYDRADLLERLSDAHLLRWERMLETFLMDFLGVEQEFLPALSSGMERIDASPLLKIVAEGGNFGHFNPARHIDAEEKARKRSTLMLFLKRFPFAMNVAPREWMYIVGSLLKGNFSH